MVKPDSATKPPNMFVYTDHLNLAPGREKVEKDNPDTHGITKKTIEL